MLMFAISYLCALNTQVSQVKLWDASANTPGLSSKGVNLSRSGEYLIAKSTEKRGTITISFSQPQNWSKFDGFALPVRNTGSDATISLAIGSENGTYSASMPVYKDDEWLVFFDAKHSGTPSPRPVWSTPYRHAVPNGKVSLTRVKSFTLNIFGSGAEIRFGDLQGITHTKLSGTGWIDRYGQLADRSWPGKVTSDSDFKKQSEIFKPYPNSDRPDKSKGAWKVIKENGKAFFQTPSGKKFWSFGLVAVQTDRPWSLERFPNAFSTLNEVPRAKANSGEQTASFYERNLQIKYGSNWKKQWLETTQKRLDTWGFNTLGNGSEDAITSSTNLAFTQTFTTHEFPVRIPIGGSTFPDPYDPGYSTWIEKRWGDDLKRFTNMPNFLGFYVDGEMPWGSEEEGLSSVFRIPIAVMRQSKSPSKDALIKLIKDRCYTPEQASSSLGVTLKSWDDFQKPIQVDANKLTEYGRAIFTQFLENFAAAHLRGFRIAANRLQVSPLILGGRDLAATPEAVFRGQAQVADVLSIDQYDRAHRIVWLKIARLPKPVLLSEFSFMGLEGNAMSGVPFSQGIVAKNQATRAQWTEQVLKEAVKHPNVIGAHWFCYLDQPLTGRPGDGENFSFGVVNVVDQPYTELANVFRKFSESMYQLR